MPDKLSRGVAALVTVAAARPAPYLAGQIFVDADGGTLGVSQPMRRAPCLLAALTQNVATGCTVMMNRTARPLGGAQPRTGRQPPCTIGGAIW